ncbi:MAG: nitroreductase family deazaflavin-dependent oxidoreductase [Sphingomonadaceae bacterium]|nr:nitroreductase family deazaflavin-dependent oxidoreductase [Sphingomonadaceae bacterium]
MSDQDANKVAGTGTGTDITLVGPEHVRVYQQTNGEEGYMWNGVPTLIFTTKGRKTGLPRTNPIIFTQVGDKYVIMASMGGSPTHPAWYLNILDDPNLDVQVKADRFAATARTAQSPEREELWAEAIKDWPNFDLYQSRTERQIPVVVIERK